MKLHAADAKLIEEKNQACCYARSNNYWVTDPTGIAWETFRMPGSVPMYDEDTPVFNHGTSVVPIASDCGEPVKPTTDSICWVPKGPTESKGACC